MFAFFTLVPGNTAPYQNTIPDEYVTFLESSLRSKGWFEKFDHVGRGVSPAKSNLLNNLAQQILDADKIAQAAPRLAH